MSARLMLIMADSSVFPRHILTILLLVTYKKTPNEKLPEIFLNKMQAARIMNMKGTRLIILILSILLLTISSGLLFYKNLFLLGPPSFGGKIDFEEIRYTDLQINATIAFLRSDFSADSSLLDLEIKRIQELMNIVMDVNKSTPELNHSILKIQSYFDAKIKNLNKFQLARTDLKNSINSINPAYNELNKLNIKFTVDKRDFYRECIVDALFYISITGQENEARLLEDKKILSQIMSFASTPNPYIQKFNNHIDVIHLRTNELKRLIEIFNDDSSINKEMFIVSKYFKEAQISKTRDAEIFLTMIFGAIVLYLISVVVILRKLT